MRQFWRDSEKRPSYRLLHLFALSAFAVAQPLLQKISGGAEFLVARRSEPIDVIALVLFLVVIIPACLAMLEMALGLLSPQVRQISHFFVVAVLAGLAILPALSLYLPVADLVCAALALGCGGVFGFLYWRFFNLRRFVSWLSVFALISPVVFMLQPSILEVLFVSAGKGTGAAGSHVKPVPVVMIVFDEFPLSTLLDENLLIDEGRYPNFASLARTSYWLRNASGVTTQTTLAVPALLTGLYPSEAKKVPSSAVHPNNLFTLLADSHDLHVFERITRLCPAQLCSDDYMTPVFRVRLMTLLADVAAIYLRILLPHDQFLGLPHIHGNWGGFWEGKKREVRNDFRRKGRVNAFRKFVNEIGPTARPALHFAHHLLPHMPYQFMPSGKRYPAPDFPRGYMDFAWGHDSWAIIQAYQQLLLQVQTCDTLIGYLVRRLKKIGLWDPSLVIITSEHGATFQPGSHLRGDPDNKYYYQDVLSIPLLIKLPYQKEGAISDRNVESVDVLPTIADVLGTRPTWRIDGQSVFDGPERDHKHMVVGRRKGRKDNARIRAFEAIDFPVPKTLPRETLDWKLELFGSGRLRPDGLFQIGPHPELFGKSADDFAITAAVDGTLELSGPARAQSGRHVWDLSLSQEELPFRLSGRVKAKGRPQDRRGLAVAINRVIRGTTYLSPAGNDDEFAFEIMLPEDAFREGRNVADFFFIEAPAGQGLRLMRLQAR